MERKWERKEEKELKRQEKEERRQRREKVAKERGERRGGVHFGELVMSLRNVSRTAHVPHVTVVQPSHVVMHDSRQRSSPRLA